MIFKKRAIEIHGFLLIFVHIKNIIYVNYFWYYANSSGYMDYV